MASIIIKGVSFVSTPSQNQTVTIKYRPTALPDVPASYTVLGTALTVAPDGTLTPNITISGLTDNTSYTIVVSNNCDAKNITKTVITQDLTTYVWVADSYICEQDSLINKVQDYAGFSSPNKMFYDDVTKRIYCVDSDSTSGNIFWFDPNTFTGIGSVTYSTAVTGKQIYDGAIDFDPIRRRIYMAGLNTGGLLVYDIAADALVGDPAQLAYGQNVGFDRLFVKNIEDYIYCSSRTLNTLCIINANTLTRVSNNEVTSTISLGGESLVDSYNIVNVNNERWVVPAAGRPKKDIYVYNSTFTTRITTITVQSQLVSGWGGSKYWGDSFFDRVRNKFYLADMGSGLVTIIDGSTRTIVSTLNFNDNKEGKVTAQVNFAFDANIGRLYLNYQGFNDASDVQSTRKQRSYIIDRNTLTVDSMYPGLISQALTPQTGTPFLWSANRGLAIWDGGGTWNTDGIITKLSY